MVAMGSLAQAGWRTHSAELCREDGRRVHLVTANAAGRAAADVVSDLASVLERVALPPGATVRVGVLSREAADSAGSAVLAIFLSVVLMYMILAAEYESVLLPLIVLASSPLAFVGAVAALALWGEPLGILSLAGLIITVGAVDNDAVIALDLIAEKIRAGKDDLTGDRRRNAGAAPSDRGHIPHHGAGGTPAPVPVGERVGAGPLAGDPAGRGSRCFHDRHRGRDPLAHRPGRRPVAPPSARGTWETGMNAGPWSGRPLVAGMVLGIVLVAGFVSAPLVAVLPGSERPASWIDVSVAAEGYTADAVDRQVAGRVEELVRTVRGVRSLRTVSERERLFVRAECSAAEDLVRVRAAIAERLFQYCQTGGDGTLGGSHRHGSLRRLLRAGGLPPDRRVGKR